jgi:hypothetical protein
MDLIKLKRYTKSSFLGLNWNKDGAALLKEDKIYFTVNEKEKLKFLLSLVPPDLENRKKVSNIQLL